MNNFGRRKQELHRIEMQSILSLLEETNLHISVVISMLPLLFFSIFPIHTHEIISHPYEHIHAN